MPGPFYFLKNLKQYADKQTKPQYNAGVRLESLARRI